MTCRTGSTILLWSHGRTPVLVRKDPISLSCGHPLFPCSVGVQAQLREASSPRDGRDGSNRKHSTTHQNLRQQPGFHGTKKRGEAFGFESGIRLTEKILQETIQTNRHKGRQAILTNNESQKKPAADASGDGRTGREMEGREDEGGVE